MNKDIRVLTSFKGHRKRKRLKLVLGEGATDYLIDLWLTAAEDRPDGVLTDWDEIDIALSCGWEGEPQVLINALIETKWLDKLDDGTYAIPNWRKNQPDVMRSLEYAENNERLYPKDWNMRRYEVFIRDDFTCVYCGKKINKPHVDHIFPRSRGGSDEKDNLATSCPDCNRRKSDKTLEEWIR